MRKTNGKREPRRTATSTNGTTHFFTPAKLKPSLKELRLKFRKLRSTKQDEEVRAAIKEMQAAIEREELHQNFRDLLPKGWRASAKAEVFLDRCDDALMVFREARLNTPTAEIVAELRTLEGRARNLQQALHLLDHDSADVFERHFEVLEPSNEYPKGEPGEEGHFLKYVQSVLADLEAGARYAAEQCTPSKHHKMTVKNARFLAQQVRRGYQATFGKLPPHSKNTWFPVFMQRLGEEVGLPAAMR